MNQFLSYTVYDWISQLDKVLLELEQKCVPVAKIQPEIKTELDSVIKQLLLKKAELVAMQTLDILPLATNQKEQWNEFRIQSETKKGLNRSENETINETINKIKEQALTKGVDPAKVQETVKQADNATEATKTELDYQHFLPEVQFVLDLNVPESVKMDWVTQFVHEKIPEKERARALEKRLMDLVRQPKKV